MAYEARRRSLFVGALLGLVASAVLMFAFPWVLASQLSMKVLPAWGLGDVAFAFCAAGALIGMVLGRRMKLFI